MLHIVLSMHIARLKLPQSSEPPAPPSRGACVHVEAHGFTHPRDQSRSLSIRVILPYTILLVRASAAASPLLPLPGCGCGDGLPEVHAAAFTVIQMTGGRSTPTDQVLLR